MNNVVKLHNFLLRECEKQKDNRLKILAAEIYNPGQKKDYFNHMMVFREKIILDQWKLRNFLRDLLRQAQ